MVKYNCFIFLGGIRLEFYVLKHVDIEKKMCYDCQCDNSTQEIRWHRN